MLKKFFFIVFVSLLVAGQALAQQASYVTNSTVTMETDGTNPDGSVNLQTNNAGRINFLTNRVNRGYIDGTTGGWTGFTLVSPTISGNLTYSSTPFAILADTADGTDNKQIVILSYNGTTADSSRGGSLTIGGNESANPGHMVARTGSAGGFYIDSANGTILRNASGVTRWTLGNSAGDIIQDATNGGDLVFNKTSGYVRQGTSDGADNKALILAGGGTNGSTRGGSVEVYGNEHASELGRVYIQAGNTTSGDINIITTNATPNINFKTNSLQRWGITGGSGHLTQDFTNGGDIVISRDSSSLRAATSDGADDIELCVTGGGACGVVRGASLYLGGNEQTGTSYANGGAGLFAGVNGGNLTIGGYNDVVVNTGISGPNIATSWTFDTNGTTTSLLGDATRGGDVILSRSGSTAAIQEGTAASACMGTANPNGTTNVTVSTTCFTTGSRVFYARVGTPTNFGHISTVASSAGVSFTFVSSGATDTTAATVVWWIVHEAP